MLVDIDGIVRYSDELMRVHQGKVVSNEDPKKIGRIKVSIEFLYVGDVANLPWVYPNNYSPTNFYVPKIDELVKVVFRNGDIYHPEYIGSFHNTVNHDTAFDADYPNTSGFSRDGFIARYNSVTEHLEIIAKNGSYLKMNKDGDTTFKTIKDLKVESAGDVVFDVDGKVDILATGAFNLTSDGTAKFAGKAGTTIGDAGSQTMVDGTIILLCGGGSPICVVGTQSIGTGNGGSPVISTATTGSSKVSAPI